MINHFKASEKLIIELARKKGFFDVRFLTNWEEIVGKEISLKCFPSRLVFDFFTKEATLLVYSEDLSFKSMLTHYKSLILQKVCLYFGINFIKDVKITKP